MTTGERLQGPIRDLRPNSPEYKRYIEGIVTQGLRFQQQAEVSRTLDRKLLGILKGI